MPLSDEVNAIRNELAAVKTELLAQDASIKALQSAVESQKAALDELKTSIAAVAPLRQEGFVPVIPTSQNTPPLEPLQIKSVPPTNPTWTPEGFRGINGALLDQREINPDYSQPFSYNSPDDIINLYYAGRMPKQYALASLKANFPDLPQNRLLQVANGPEWYNPGPTPRRVRWDPGSPNNRGGFVYDTGKSQWE